MSDLNTPGPANIYVILDEHPDSINDGAFMLDAGHWSSTTEHWRDFPGSFHDNGVSISFADGHSEIHRWVEGRTCQVVEYKSFSTATPPATSPLNQGVNLTKSADYEWMLDRMPYR
jgi:prepilin-type processing-associated H-X9-DG protein